jgi:hypothetical protein
MLHTAQYGICFLSNVQPEMICTALLLIATGAFHTSELRATESAPVEH